MHKFLKYSRTWYFSSEAEANMSQYHKAEGTTNRRTGKKTPKILTLDDLVFFRRLEMFLRG